jgi:hypothetical protein
MKSETKIPSIAKTDHDFWITDSAGLDDTTGPIFDIANSIGLGRLLKNTKSIRVLTLLHESTVRGTDGKGKSLRGIIELILGFFGTINDEQFNDIIQATCVMITHSEVKQKVLN